VGLIDQALAGGGLKLRGSDRGRLVLIVPPQPQRARAQPKRQGRADQGNLWSSDSHELVSVCWWVRRSCRMIVLLQYANNIKGWDDSMSLCVITQILARGVG